ncbi:MAG: complex I NDUFA9 subunit family protein [Trueperaceae bacterium]|nr:complex I NDUFA9 subunit family protein [Trueperaceae bacterium]
MNVLVTGASGFVGRHLCTYLLHQGHRVIGLARSEGAELPGVEWVRGDVVTGAGLADAMTHAQAVIHLVGIIREKGKQITFEQVHVEGTRNVVGAALEADLERFVHMSALGAVEGAKSRYFETKARAETIVRESGLRYTIHRPSLIFGQGDDFFGETLKNLVEAGPVVPQIGDGHFPFRPIWVGDVARAFEQSLTRSAADQRSFDLVGPTEYSFRELLELIRRTLGSRKPIVPVPLPLMRVAVPLLQILPNPPITSDQFEMLLAGNTGDPTEATAAFDLVMAELPEHLPRILALA